MAEIRSSFCVGFAALLLGCGSTDTELADACEPPVIVGSPFSSAGTATLEGTGTLPRGIPDGSSISLLLSTDDGTGFGVLPDDILDPDNWTYTCGRSVEYTVRSIEAGTYRLEFDSWAPGSDAKEPEYVGLSTETFTIADGQTLRFDAAFDWEVTPSGAE